MTRAHLVNRRLAIAVAAAALLASAACSSDKSPTRTAGSGSGSNSTAAAAIPGAKRLATGAPALIGYVYDGTSETIDAAGELAAAKAAAQYVNGYLGGIGGHPIKLDECSTDQTPSGAAACVNKFARDKVPAVLNGVTGQAGALFPKLSAAGIQVFVSETDPSIDGATVMRNGILEFLAGPAKIAADRGIKKAAIVVLDVPTATGALKGVAPIFYKNVGMTVDVVPVPLDTPDMTPNIQAEFSKGPGAFAIIGDPVFCGKAMNALSSVGFKGMISIVPNCIDDTFLKNAPNLDGVVVVSSTTTDPKSKEFQLYEAVMHTYAPKVDLGSPAPVGYQAVVGFARALKGLTGGVTSAKIKAALQAMPPTPMPLADGITFQCDGKQVAIRPSICSKDALKTTLDAKGKPTGYKIMRGAGLLHLG